MEPPSSQRPCWYPDCPPSPNPEGTSCSVYVCISIYTSVLPGLPPSLGSKSQGVFVQVTPTQSVPLPHPQLCLEPPTTFCVVLHGFAVMEKVETQQSLKLDPGGQVDRSQARPPTGAGREVRGREGRGEPMARVVPQAGENQVAFSHIPGGAEGMQPSDNTPLDGPENVLLAIRPLLTVTNSGICGMSCRLGKPHPDSSSSESPNTPVRSPGQGCSSTFYRWQ